MNINKIALPESPNVLKSIRNGFDAITKHLILLLFPIGLDLVLWFAPHLQIKTQIEGIIAEMGEVSALLSPDFGEMVEAGQEIWLMAAERINLVLALRSFPIGIFSLLSSILPVENPLGNPIFWDVPQLSIAVIISLALFLTGLVFGGLYFSGVRQAALYDDVKWRTILQEWPRISIQSFLLSLIWIILFLGILVLGSCVATGITLFSVSLGQLVIILFGIVSFWLVFPLFFSPHGIFTQGQRAWKSLMQSIRLTNMTFFKTGLFIMLAILVNQGLNLIWQVAPENSWLMVISIIGHAFVTTGMLAASFVYYQDMIRWFEELQLIGKPKVIEEERPTIEK
ncbi:MAG: hypothetical protein MUO54_09495 [Anaerolineales bacterium]|nr:hypothetical protein [Anaerolineales bacterium]